VLSLRHRIVYAQVYVPVFRDRITCSLLIAVFLITCRVIWRVRAVEKACTLLETEKHINSLQYFGVGDTIIFKQIIEKESESKNKMDLSSWVEEPMWLFVRSVMNFRVEYYVLLGYCALSLNTWFPTFRSKVISRKLLGPIFYWRSVVF